MSEEAANIDTENKTGAFAKYRSALVIHFSKII